MKTNANKEKCCERSNLLYALQYIVSFLWQPFAKPFEIETQQLNYSVEMPQIPHEEKSFGVKSVGLLK